MTSESSGNSFFLSRQKLLGLAASAYVVLLLLSHWKIPAIHVWIIAAFFSMAMNFTYLTEALYTKKYAATEFSIAVLLISTSLAGLYFSPLFIIAAIFGHGCWDLAKHFGTGIPFLFWYTCSCFLVDTTYSVSLLIYYISIT